MRRSVREVGQGSAARRLETELRDAMSTYSDALVKYQPRIIKTEADYRRAMTRFSELQREYEVKPSHDLGALMDLCAMLIERYEFETSPMPEASPAQLLGHLLESRELSRSEFARELEISRGQVTNILNGTREISRTMAIKLGESFSLRPSLFLGVD
ncbi:MAG: helix-turn-helix domain-containing protein [Myxococcota bacterium]